MKYKYCSKCGRELIRKVNEAQKEIMPFPIYGGRFDKYNIESGKQQYVEWFECPKYHWWNGHDTLWAHLIK